MDNVQNNMCGGNGRVSTHGEWCTIPELLERGGAFSAPSGETRVYVSKLECLVWLGKKIREYFTTGIETYDENFNYTSHFNSWLNSTNYVFASGSYKHYPGGNGEYGNTRSYYTATKKLQWRTREGLVTITSYKEGYTKKQAENYVCWYIMQKIYSNSTEKYRVTTEYIQEHDMVHVQMMSDETEQGVPSQDSDQQHNTIITRDQAQAEIKPDKALDEVSEVASSEAIHHFPTLSERWMPLKPITVSTSAAIGTSLQTYYLPEELYTESKCAPNLVPFRNFIYGRMNLEVRLVANANKFCCGKLIMSSKYDTYQADELCNGYQSALARNHVIIDLATNNEGLLDIPFRYHRPYVRLVSNTNTTLGIRPSKYCSVYVQVLSPLQTGPGGASEINIRAYYRFKKLDLAGMSYGVTVQGLGVEDLISEPTRNALKEVLIGAEKAFDQLGKSSNQDKPGRIEAVSVVPQPRLNFPSGKGVIDVHPLTVNPHTLTNYKGICCPTDEPKSFYDLARIWGIYKTFTWSSSTTTGTELINMTIDPTCRNYSADYSGEPTPLEYAASCMAFWNGTIELRFDFVSNMFHTGTVQISAEFGRTSTASDECESGSTYVKTFHLGEQKSVTFRVPYIYDTIMRRSTNGYYNPYQGAPATTAMKQNALSVAPISNTRVKVRVLNELRPAQSAPQSIEVLVFMRAGKNFAFHGLKGASYISVNSTQQFKNFPGDGYTPALSTAVATFREDIPAVHRKEKNATTGKEEYIIISNAKHNQRLPHYDIGKNDRNKYNEKKSKSLKFPTVQMDTGEKEDQDPTDNFKEGVSVLPHITTDNHMLFKDLLRRPTLLIQNDTVKVQTAGSYFIPLQPPTRQMCPIGVGTNNRTMNSIFATSLPQTTAVAIMDMFRAWRGRMRYTICVTTNTPLYPVYVSLIPHSGTRIVGNHQFVAQTLNYPIYGSNFTTEMIIPSINPTMTIEAPYDTENTWTLVADEDSARNYTWRDKGDYNSGHICLTSNSEFQVTVWWSAGDDFEIANFYGIPNVFSNGWAYRYDDNVKVQINPDFSLAETSTKVASFCTDNVGLITKTAFAAVPVVGPAYLMADTTNTISKAIINAEQNVEKITKEATECMTGVSNNINNTVLEANATIKNINDKMETLSASTNISISSLSSVVSTAIESLTSTLGSIVTRGVLLYDLVLDLLVAWMEKSWRVVGLGIVRAITKICSVNPIKSVLDWGITLSNFIAGLISQPVVTVQMGPRDDELNEKTLWGILAGVLGSVLGVSLSGVPWRHVPGATLVRFTTTTGVSYLVQVLRFVTTTFTYIKELVLSALGMVSVEAQALKMLSNSNDTIKKFVSEAQLITSEANTGLLNRPNFRMRVWKNVLQAHQLQRLISRVPTNTVSYQLSKLCQDVIKFSNEKFLDLAAAPVRYEPFVLVIQGDPGVGKSHMTEDLVVAMLEYIGYNNPATETIYYRTAGEKFWSGYRDQPVIVYDEWLNTCSVERNIDQIAEFMKLKSTGIFIPEMAHLEEKKIRGNPLIIVMLCNEAFPNLGDYARCPKAVFRRRDLLLKCQRTDSYANVNMHQYSGQEEISRTKPHLEFRKYKDVGDSQSIINTPKTYGEMLDYVCKTFKRYHTLETTAVKRRLARLSDLSSINPDDLNMEDPFTLFYGLNSRIVVDEEVSQNGWTPYEQLEVAVTRLNSAIRLVDVEEVPEVPEEISWEQAVSTAQTQIHPGILLGAALFSSPMVLWAARATKRTLIRWEREFLEKHPSGEQTCMKCNEDVIVWYSCETADEHRLCVKCFYKNLRVEESACQECGAVSWKASTTDRTMAQLSVYARLYMNGVVTIRTLVSKIEKLMKWKNSYPVLSFLTDFMLCLTASVQTDSVLPLFVPYLTRKIYVQMNEEGTFQEIDVWDNYPQVSSTLVPVVESTDAFKPVLNEVEFGKWCEPIEQVACVHNQLLEASIVDTKLVDKSWLYVDRSTMMVVEVPTSMCKKCNISVSNYKKFVLEFIESNAKEWRKIYITYFMDPQSSLEELPLIARNTWMIPVVFTGIGAQWWDYLSEKWAEYKKLILYAFGIVSVAAAIVGTYTLASRLLSSDDSDEVPIPQYGGTVGSAEPLPRQRRTEVRRSTGERRYFQASSETPLLIEVVEKYVAKNMMRFILTDGTKEQVMYGVGLFNTTCLIPRHYVLAIQRQVPKGYWVEVHPVTQPQLREKLTIDSNTFIVSENTDIAYLKLPPKFPLFKDLRKYCAEERDLKQPLCAEGILLAGPRPNCDYLREITVEVNGVKAQQVITDVDGSWFEVRDVMRYRFSQPGACGAILLRPSHTRPILSMHIAGVGEGVNGEGYGVILTQESLRKLSEGEVVVQYDDTEYGSIEDAKFVFDDTIHLSYLGSVPKEQTPHIPSKTKLVKSEIYNAPGLTVDVAPAILSAADSRYNHDTTPLYEGVKKHGIITDDFTEAQVLRAKERLWDVWFMKMKPIVAQPRRLTVEEAIVGFPGINHYTGMDLRTSAGYPFNLQKEKTKESYIKVIRDAQDMIVGVDSVDEYLQTIISLKEKQRRNGIIPHTLFIDTLKDEKRKEKKLMAKGGTRVFCSSPLDYVIACRQNFMHFIASFMENRHDLMHAVGINPTSSEWSRLTRNLLVKGNNIGTIDYTNFGPGYNSRVAEAAYNIMIDWVLMYVEDVNEVELRCIVWECIHSMHICNNTVYRQFAGSPSGAVFTTIVNTIVNLLYLLIAWESLTENALAERNELCCQAFRKNVALYTYGDDAIFSVTDEYKDLFNSLTIANYFAQYRIVATDATKAEEIQELLSIKDAQFLKRGFKIHPQRPNEWLSPLSEVSLLSTTQWVWKSGNNKEATIVNCMAALLQAHGHGPEYYQKFKNAINSALIRSRCDTITLTWAEIDNKYFTAGLEQYMDDFINSF